MKTKILSRIGSTFGYATIFLFLSTFFPPFSAYPDGGMYPINQIPVKKVQQSGLKIPVKEIYNPDSISLLQAIVNLGGCTASFVSEDGLILTNHHCVFGSLKPYSTSSNNLMDKGFLALAKNEELPIENGMAKIMVNYTDVTAQILQGISADMDPVARKVKIQANASKILNEDKKNFPEYQAEISEMMMGKSYLLFRYQVFNDVRVVYVPPREIGEYGGELDNWMWPRHSADFSFARVYTAPDGKPARYNKENVPYKPKKIIKVNSKGVREGDFIFILGYPGRTFRNRPAEFLKLMEEFQMPFIADFFEYAISTYEALIKKEPALKITYDPMIKSLANTSKNYRGKLKSLNSIDLYQSRKSDEIISYNKLMLIDPLKAKAFLATKNSIDSLYGELFRIIERNMMYSQASNRSEAFYLARLLGEYYFSANSTITKQNCMSSDFMKEAGACIRGLDWRTDKVFLKYLFETSLTFRYRSESLTKFFPDQASIDRFFLTAYDSKLLTDSFYACKLIVNRKAMEKSKDPWVKLALALYQDIYASSQMQSKILAAIDAMMPLYLDYLMLAAGEEFLPDANSTLRFTFGNIKGYYPADAVYMSPFTRLSGVIEKAGFDEEYVLNEKLVIPMDNLRINRFYEPSLQDIPVCVLYNADTTGGNSGSPVLNANGELIGLNFDRTFEATVNDFAWNDAYSRSVAVDIRYILFIAQTVSKADYLLKEMGVI